MKYGCTFLHVASWYKFRDKSRVFEVGVVHVGQVR